MKVKRIIGGWLESNCYIIYDEKTREGYIIDPGYEKQKYIDFVKEKNLKIHGVLLTHHHSDHSGEAKSVRSMLKCPVYIHEKDGHGLERIDLTADVLLQDGDILMLGDQEIQVINTPGHTHGSVCFLLKDCQVAFTGDTVFNVDLGRTDLEDGSPEEMVCSVVQVIDTWSDELFIYPGHGDGCTMNTVRRINTEFLEITE